ncbi:MAG: restriction endonuclease subunit S [bacterium]|nr:restriction endonuclease subunit S [bacterium]
MELKPGYKQTEAGAVPTDWVVIDLSELCTLQRGFDITEATRSPGTVPVYSSSGHSYYHNKAMVPPPGVVTGRKGLLGRVFLINEPFWPHDTTLWAKDFRGNHPAYVALVLQNFHLERLDAATSVPTLNRNNLAGHSVAIPNTKAEQEAIAEVLSDADALVESLEQLIAKKRLLKQGTMQELLTGKKRLPGFEIKPGYRQTKAGIIPHDWTLDYIENLAHIATGSRNTQDRVDDGQYPFFVRSQTIERINSYSFDGEAVLTAGDGVGTGRVFHYINGKFDTHQRVYRISDFSGRVNGSFFYLYFSSNFYSRIMQMTAKSSVDSVRREMIARMLVPLPPTKAEQDAIANILSDMDAEIAALEAKLAKARQIKKGMMQQLLTGRIRLV